MSRDLTASMISAFGAATVWPVMFAKMEFPGGTVRLCSHTASLTYDSETYTGLGTLGVVSDIEETIDESSNNVTLTLSAASSVVALALTEPVRGARVRLWRGLLNSGGTLIADPALEFSGTASHMSHSDDGTSGSVTLHIVDETGDQERPLDLRYTDAEQQRMYPGDTGLRYVTTLPNQEFTWGNTRVYTAQPGGDDGTDGGSDDQFLK